VARCFEKTTKQRPRRAGAEKIIGGKSVIEPKEPYMKRKSFFIAIASGLFLMLAAANAATIRIQGRLTDNTGAPIIGQANLIKISLYSASTGGTVLAQALGDDGHPGTQLAVPTNDAGLFSADADFGATNAFDSGNDIYVDMQVHSGGDFRHLSPRQKLSTVPYAIRAQTANQSNTTLNVGDNSVGSNQIVNASIQSVDLATAAVTTANIATGAITTVTLAQSAVTDSKVNDVSAIKITGQLSSDQIGSLDGAKITGFTGMIIAFGGSVAPSGWLLCDGRTVSRAVYTSLFGIIGTSFGAGDGISTFNIPDLRGTFLRGRDAGAGIDSDRNTRFALNAGGSTGDSVGSVQNSATAVNGLRIPDHRHTIPSPDPGHYGLIRRSIAGENNTAPGADTQGSGTEPDLSAAPQGGVTDMASLVLSGDSETRPRNVYVNYLIKY
jgi:hypothetical protein